MHRVAEAVPAEVEVDGDAVGIGDVTDGLRDIAEAVAGLGGTDSGFEAGPRGVDEALVLFAAVADDGGAGGIGDPAVDGYGEVEGEQIAVLEHIAVRFAVEDAVVDGQTDDIAEGAGAEGRGVVPVAGLRAGIVDELPCGLLQVHDVHARFCDRGQLGQGLRDETAGHRHLVDLGGRLQLNHRGLLRRGAGFNGVHRSSLDFSHRQCRSRGRTWICGQGDSCGRNSLSLGSAHRTADFSPETFSFKG